MLFFVENLLLISWITKRRTRTKKRTATTQRVMSEWSGDHASKGDVVPLELTGRVTVRHKRNERLEQPSAHRDLLPDTRSPLIAIDKEDREYPSCRSLTPVNESGETQQNSFEELPGFHGQRGVQSTTTRARPSAEHSSAAAFWKSRKREPDIRDNFLDEQLECYMRNIVCGVQRAFVQPVPKK